MIKNLFLNVDVEGDCPIDNLPVAQSFDTKIGKNITIANLDEGLLIM